MDSALYLEIKELAHKNAMEVIRFQESGGDGEGLQFIQLKEFQNTRQHSMAAKAYTALYRTYNDWFMAVMEEHYKPGTARVVIPIAPESILDGDEIATPKTPELWQEFLLEVEALAQRFARETANLATSGGDTKTRMAEQQMEAAQFEFDHSLTVFEGKEFTDFYKKKYIEALKLETDVRLSLRNGTVTNMCQELVEANWKIFLKFASAGTPELGKECILQFDKRINEVGNGLHNSIQRQEFLKAIEDEREILFEEYTNSPETLKSRLNGPFKVRSSINKTTSEKRQQSSHSAQNLGSTVVNTAVRATIWEIVVSIFRFMR